MRAEARSEVILCELLSFPLRLLDCLQLESMRHNSLACASGEGTRASDFSHASIAPSMLSAYMDQLSGPIRHAGIVQLTHSGDTRTPTGSMSRSQGIRHKRILPR